MDRFRENVRDWVHKHLPNFQEQVKTCREISLLPRCRHGHMALKFCEKPFFWISSMIFLTILEFILTSIFEIKIYEKHSLTPKNFISECRFLITIINLIEVIDTAYREQLA